MTTVREAIDRLVATCEQDSSILDYELVVGGFRNLSIEEFSVDTNSKQVVIEKDV